jgi:hypothetical protein
MIDLPPEFDVPPGYPILFTKLPRKYKKFEETVLFLYFHRYTSEDGGPGMIPVSRLDIYEHVPRHHSWAKANKLFNMLRDSGAWVVDKSKKPGSKRIYDGLAYIGDPGNSCVRVLDED